MEPAIQPNTMLASRPSTHPQAEVSGATVKSAIQLRATWIPETRSCAAAQMANRMTRVTASPALAATVDAGTAEVELTPFESSESFAGLAKRLSHQSRRGASGRASGAGPDIVCGGTGCIV